MSTIDETFSEFTRAWLAGEEPDPVSALEGFSGTDRLELADLIDGFVELNTGLLKTGPVDPAEFERAKASNPILQRIGRSVAGVSGVWPSMLPRLRERAQLNREDIVQRLSAELGNPQGAEKIGDYYHRMEWGDLPAAGVNDRVLEALARVLGSDAEALRQSGLRDESQGSGSFDDPAVTQARVQAFARFSAGENVDFTDFQTNAATDKSAWDETDTLFLGG